MYLPWVGEIATGKVRQWIKSRDIACPQEIGPGLRIYIELAIKVYMKREGQCTSFLKYFKIVKMEDGLVFFKDWIFSELKFLVKMLNTSEELIG